MANLRLTTNLTGDCRILDKKSYLSPLSNNPEGVALNSIDFKITFMKLEKLLLLFFTVISISSLSAQDIHNTLFNLSPLTLNPALTGAFEGTARIGGIYRAQDFALDGGDGYSTPSFYIDAPIFRGFGKRDWIGAGMMFFQDNSGTLNLKTTTSQLSGSYHLSLDKNSDNMLTFAVQWGQVTRGIDPSRGVFSDTFSEAFGGLGNPSSEDPLANGGSSPSPGNPGRNDSELTKNFSDVGAGIMLRSNINDDSKLELGIAYGHLTTPRYNLISGGSRDANKRPAKIVAHGRLVTPLRDKWTFEPTFLFQTTSAANELGLQAWAGHQINPDTKLNFGLGYRIGDAGKILFGIEHKDLTAAVAYDLSLSSRTQVNNYQGAIEFAAFYILKIYKKPDVKPAILCPRF